MKQEPNTEAAETVLSTETPAVAQERLVRPSYVVEKLAFEGPEKPDRGYTVKAYYLTEPNSRDALVEIYKDGEEVRHFLFPAYKIWNIPAHFTDIVDGEIEKSSRGYEMAAWDGITGAAIILPNDEMTSTHH